MSLELVFSRLFLTPAPGEDAAQRRAQFPLLMNRIERVLCGPSYFHTLCIHPEFGALSSFSGCSA